MRKLFALSLVVGLNLLALPAIATTTPKPGGKCNEIGVTKTVNALTYKCKKATKKQYVMFQYKYIWNKGKLKSSSANLGESIDGRKFSDGAIAGTDIKAGRYWSMNCADWQQFDDNGLIAKALRGGSQQSLIDLKTGETLLSGCKWYLGEPPAAKVLPTGKLSMKTQLLPGKYRPVNEFCMTGPTDTRSPDAISEATNSNDIIVWEQKLKNFTLIVTGNENWKAYGLTSECGGLIKLD